MTPRNGTPHDRIAPTSAETLLGELRRSTSSGASEALCERIVEITLGLADAAARTYIDRGIEAEDLVQVARLGLMKAIRGYDPDRGCSFAAFAVPTITGEIKRHFRDQGWLVKPPRGVQELRSRMVIGEEDLRARLRRNPTTEEVADHLGVRPCSVSETKVASRGFAGESLSTFTGSRRAMEPAAEGDPFQDFVDWESARLALRTLTPRQRHVLRLRFVDDLTQAQIARRLGVSQMQVSRILTRCLTQLRAHMGAECPPARLGGPHRPPEAVRRATDAPAMLAG